MKQKRRDLTQLQKNLKKSSLLLKTLKDDFRVEVHLAGMEARTRWQKLAPHFSEVERLAREVSASSKEAVKKLMAKRTSGGAR